MRTAAEILLERASTLSDALTELLDRSGLSQMDRDWGSAVWLGPTGEWAGLPVEAQRLQSRILEDYGKFFETISVLLRGQPSDALRTLEQTDRSIREIIEQSQLSWLTTIDEARERAAGAIEKQASLLHRLHDGGEGTEVYVPDTNALLYNLELDRWRFRGSSRFELVLGPAILVELDELKVNHRNPDVRAKAESLIKRIKGYRARGQLVEGVPLDKHISTLRALPTEPQMSESLPWLDPGNRDDRFIATVIELIRQRSRSAVTIVTRDINLQSKAELASLPFVEPPEPGATS